MAGIVSFGGPASAKPPPGVWNHNPASPIGPYHWGNIGLPLPDVCGTGGKQSPVNIATDHVAPYHGPPLLLTYETSELIIENTGQAGGHYVEVPNPVGTAQIGGQSYGLTQYHFHVPSEHAVNGRLADLEAHLVHTNAQGVIAVVGVFFRIGPDPNALLDKILLTAPDMAGEVSAGEASPAELFRHICGVSTTRGGPVTVNSFYSCNGSLTTPGCAQGVLWSVLADGGHVSYAAVTRFHQLIARFPYYYGYPNNNRPLQLLNGRVIQLRRSGKDD